MLRLESKFFGEHLKDSAEALLPDAIEKLDALVQKKCSGREFTGWFDWPELKGFDLDKKIDTFVSELAQPYDTVVVVGIGGSYLGTKSIVETLSHSFSEALEASKKADYKNVVFAGQNLSEVGLIELLDYLETRHPVVNVISKSGTTTEPGAAFRVLKEYMDRRYGAAACQRIIATTDPDKGALRTLSEQNGYKTFEVPSDVGGRFSVLTAVGLLPLRLAGYKTSQLLQGAHDFFTCVKKTHQDPSGRGPSFDALSYAAHRIAAWNAGNRVEILAYGESKMRGVSEWWKQLYGESEGKGGKGLFPASLAYTTDLHSLGQYVQEGVRNQLETFLFVEDASSKADSGLERRLRVPEGSALDGLDYLEGVLFSDINNGALKATELAHFDAGVPCLELHLKDISEYSLGYLFAFFEVSCSVSALMLGVNPFDQPGVEAYKKNLFAIMGRPGFEELKASLMERMH